MESGATSIVIRPNKTAIIYTLIVGLLIVCLYPVMWIREIHAGPIVVWGFRFILSYFLFEIIVMLTKPIGLSYHGGSLEAKYLLSKYQFLLSGVNGYSTLQYSTRYGLKNSIVFYLNNGKTVEINEVMMERIAPLQEMVEQSEIQFYGSERSYFFTSYPFRKYHQTSSVN